MIEREATIGQSRKESEVGSAALFDVNAAKQNRITFGLNNLHVTGTAPLGVCSNKTTFRLCIQE